MVGTLCVDDDSFVPLSLTLLKDRSRFVLRVKESEGLILRLLEVHESD